MLNNPTTSKLNEMKLFMLAELFANPSPGMADLDFEERFSLMIEQEWYAKRNARIARLVKRARFPMQACIEDIRYSKGRNIKKKEIVSLGECNFITSALNVIISGKTGSGKSYLACALGQAACRKTYPAKYFRLPDLFAEMEIARFENRYLKFMESLKRVKLLIIDDIGLKTYSHEEARELLEIAELRYGKASTIFISQVPQEKWYDLIPDPTIADAFLDRVIHNAYILTLDSDQSMRKIMAKEQLSTAEAEV